MDLAPLKLLFFLYEPLPATTQMNPPATDNDVLFVLTATVFGVEVWMSRIIHLRPWAIQRPATERSQ
jgi:hypothetical protein